MLSPWTAASLVVIYGMLSLREQGGAARRAKRAEFRETLAAPHPWTVTARYLVAVAWLWLVELTMIGIGLSYLWLVGVHEGWIAWGS